MSQLFDGAQKLTVSEEWTDSQKLKVDPKFIGWTWSKIVAASLVMVL